LINATYQEQLDEEAQRDVERQKVDEQRNDDEISESKERVSNNTADSLENEGSPDVIMNYIIQCILKPMRKAEIP
jgi:hypothetical protein